MNKTELIKNAAQAINADINATRDAVNAFLHCLGHTLADGQDVTIQDFGSFHVKKAEACIKRNPRTGQPLQVPAKMKVSFKPAKALKDTVNFRQ